MIISTKNRRLHLSITENKYYNDLFESLHTICIDKVGWYHKCPKMVYNILLGDYTEIENTKYFKSVIFNLGLYPIRDISRFRVCWHYWLRSSNNTVHNPNAKYLYKF